MYMKLNNNLLNIKNTHSTSETDVYSANQTNVEIANAIDNKRVVLYTNTSNNFNEQDVNINLTPYSYIEIIFYTETDVADWKYIKSTGKIANISGVIGTMGDYISNRNVNSSPQYFGRNYTLSTNKISFTNGYNYNGTTYSNRNSSGVPIQVIGYK